MQQRAAQLVLSMDVGFPEQETSQPRQEGDIEEEGMAFAKSK